MGREHDIECPHCGTQYGGFNGPDECDCDRAHVDRLTTETARLAAEVEAYHRELERWRHGVTIEGDYVCPDSLALTAARQRITELERENARMIADLNLSGVDSACCNRMRDRDYWRDRAEALKTELHTAEANGETYAIARDELRLKVDALNGLLDATADEFRSQVADARREADRMRPVFEAAVTWGRTVQKSWTNEYDRALLAALDAATKTGGE